MEKIIFIGNVKPFNEQKPNYQGSFASGAKGKQKPINNLKEEEKEEEEDDS